MLYVCKLIYRLTFINGAMYRIYDKYVSNSSNRNSNHKKQEGTYTNGTRDTEAPRGLCQEKGTAKSYGDTCRPRESSKGRQYVGRAVVSFCKGILQQLRKDTHERQEGKNRRNTSREVKASLSFYFSKLTLTIMYVDMLDTHPTYAYKMLKELWHDNC